MSALDTRIEQAIARGLDDKAAAKWAGCDAARVRDIRVRLDTRNAIPDLVRAGERHHRLIEAAAAETARVYGSCVPEHHNRKDT